MWKLIVGLLLLASVAQAQQFGYSSGATPMANATVTGTAAPIVDRFRTSFTVEILPTAVGCVWLMEVEGSCPTAFAVGEGAKLICRGVTGGDPPGWEFEASSWSGQICAKTATGYTSVPVSRAKH